MLDRGIVVGMADMKVVKYPSNICTIGLGSCVGITMYDSVSKVGGLLHSMLPSINEIHDKSNKLKFTDSGIVELYNEMIRNGANKSFIVAKIAGGADMFSFKSYQNVESIGTRNYKAGIKKLKELGIRIAAEDCGKNYGRTIILATENGSLQIKAVGMQNKMI